MSASWLGVTAAASGTFWYEPLLSFDVNLLWRMYSMRQRMATCEERSDEQEGCQRSEEEIC